jgi:signal transduction histidine kinase
MRSVGTGPTDHHTALPTPVRTSLWLVAYVVASLLGRIVVIGPASTAVVWPAAGIALLWLLSSPRRNLPIDSLLLVAATAIVLMSTGGGRTAVFALLVPLQTLIAVWLLRTWVPGIWGTGGRHPFDRLGQFGRILLAVGVAALVHSLIRTVLGALLLDESWLLGVGRLGRQAAAMSTIGAFGILLGGWVQERRDAGLPLRVRVTPSDALHLVGITASIVAVLVIGFLLNPSVPTPFLLALVIVWAAVRFDIVVTAAVCLVAGVMTVVATILGYGPIAQVRDPEGRALLAQVLVIVLMVIGLTIATTRRQLSATITQLRRSQAEVSARAALQDRLLANLSDGVAVVDDQGHFVLSNDALRQIMTGRREGAAFTGQVRSPSDYHLTHPDGRVVESEEYPYRRALEGETVVAETFHVRRGPAGAHQVIEISADALPAEPGRPRRAMVVVRDVTAAATHRESLVAFAGTVAHDLNNPLSVIDGWAEALQEDLAEIDDPAASFSVSMVGHIRSSVVQMRELISDLLAHAVARDQALRCEPLEVQNLVKHVVASRNLSAADGEVVTGDPAQVWADRVLLRQLLDNLISNALKYVAPGVLPRVVVDTEPASPGWVRIRVQDNGIGIDPEERDRVFDRFTRLTADNYAGHGLGLAICKRIVERHGGTIEVGDTPTGRGTCFTFTLPTIPEALGAAGERPE